MGLVVGCDREVLVQVGGDLGGSWVQLGEFVGTEL
jgi:hypothetical protein